MIQRYENSENLSSESIKGGISSQSRTCLIFAYINIIQILTGSTLKSEHDQFSHNNNISGKHSTKYMNISIDIMPAKSSPQQTIQNETSTSIQIVKAPIRRTRPARRSRLRMASSSWSRTEDRKYIRFIGKNEQLFSKTPRERKEIRINVLMSQFIKTRTPAQCHSHHQKMMIKHECIQNIIRNHAHLLEKPKSRGETSEPEPEPEPESTIQASLGNPEGINFQQKNNVEPSWEKYIDLNNHYQENYYFNDFSS